MTLAHALLLIFWSVSCRASPVPLPQAVTAAIAPSGSPPSSCTSGYPGVFGIAVMNISIPSYTSSTLVRRQTVPGSWAPLVLTLAQVSEIGHGQIQGGLHTVTMAPVRQIADGQIQNPVATTQPDTAGVSTSRPPSARPTVTETVTLCACSSSTRSSLDLGSMNMAPCAGVGVMPTLTTEPRLLLSSGSIPPTRTGTTTAPTTSSSLSSSSILSSSGAPAKSPSLSLVSCLTNSTLRLNLANNTLYDGLNRTGYIASNYQFQFDGPPQSGAIYTSGWSVCPVGNSDGLMTLALGGSTTFWQCLSGEFYNLYTENWAAQCNAVEIRVVDLVACNG